MSKPLTLARPATILAAIRRAEQDCNNWKEGTYEHQEALGRLRTLKSKHKEALRGQRYQ